MSGRHIVPRKVGADANAQTKAMLAREAKRKAPKPAPVDVKGWKK
jgi:hypothetical protein